MYWTDFSQVELGLIIDIITQYRLLKTKIGNKKTIMSISKVIPLNNVKKNDLKENPFSGGFYHWVMFILSLYTRVREKLNIDYESFIILQVVVSHSLYEINKTGDKTVDEVEE